MALGSVLTKDDMIAALSAGWIPHAKSWNKRRLLETLVSQVPDAIAKAAAGKIMARVKPEYAEELCRVKSRALTLEDGFRLLCFVPSGL
jgi:Mn-dependent DtxR family transcriptional regulator